MKKLIPLLIALTAFSACPIIAQTTASTPAPAASPSPAKHKHSKKKAIAPAGSPAAGAPSASPAHPKHSWLKKMAAAAAASPASGATSTTAPASAPEAANTAPAATPAPGGGAGQVWVNTTSHVYHMQGSKYYGKTKHGKYISEADAIKEGDHPSKSDSK